MVGETVLQELRVDFQPFLQRGSVLPPLPEQAVRINIDDIDFDGFDHLYEGEPITGEVVEMDPDGNLVALTPVVGGVKNGIERAWYPDGTLKRETALINGYAVGTSREWHPNGRLADERDFDERGELVAIRQWTDDGSPVEQPPGRASGTH